MTMLALCCTVLQTKAQYNVDRLLMGGRVALHYEDYVLSIQYFNQAISQKPYLWEPWQLRAIAKYYLEDWQGAESDATEAIQLNPYVTSLYDLRGISRIRQGHYADAITDYSKAIELDNGNQNYWYNRAACYVENKEYDTAHIQLDTIIKRWKKFASPYLMKSEAYLHQKDTAKAAEWIAKSLEVDPYNADAWRARGNIALQKQEWKDADTYLSKTIHFKPKDANSYINRALARLKLNNLRGAMSDYDTALEIAPNNFLAHYNRGLLRQQVGDDNRAIEDFNYVLELEPGNIMALFNRATLLDRTGDLRGAIRDYSLVIEKFPNFWTGLQYRAACYRRLGMTAKAEKDEFVILKAQMDKHLGIQQRWSRSKLSAMRKLSDIDPEKYDQLVVEDETTNEHTYKSEYRGKIQNRHAEQQYLPYIALTMDRRRTGITSYTPFDNTAEKYLEQLRKLLKESPQLLPSLGGVGEGTGVSTFEKVDMLSTLIDASRNQSDITALLLLRSIAYSTAQNYQDALKDIATVLEAEPESPTALWQRAVCGAMLAEYEQTNTPMETSMRYAGVMADFNKLLSRDKDNAYILYCQGTFCARKGEYKKAIELLSKAIEIDPRLPHAYFNRGIAYINSGDMSKAKADLSKAGELGIYSAYNLIKSKNK